MSTSLASSESLSTSLRSSELRNLQQLVENPVAEVNSSGGGINVGTGINIIDGQRLPPQTLDLASSANTATSMLSGDAKDLSSPELVGTASRSSIDTMTHMHPHLHLQQQPTSSKMLQHKMKTSSSATSSTAAKMEQQTQQNR